MSDNRRLGLRRCTPFPAADFSISTHQLVATGRPHQSIRDLLDTSDEAGIARLSTAP